MQQVVLKEKVSEERTLLMKFSNSHFVYMFISDFYIEKGGVGRENLVEHIWEE